MGIHMMKSKTLMIVFIMLLFAAPLVFAPDPIPNPEDLGTSDDPDIPNLPPGGTGTGSISVDSSKISGALLGLCQTVKSLLGVAMMLMVVSAAIVYSLGQVMGAETRARASVWATSMFNGAIIAALIYLIVPWVLNQMLLNSGVTVTC
jgi:hypothetical protein